MRTVPFLLLLATCFNCNNAKDNSTDVAGADSASKTIEAMAYTKSDLRKIKWIEGKWKGMANGQPFYEIYELVNDSTLQITSFEWNGKDSSKTDKSFVRWQDGAYFLGEKMNYKVTGITDKEIKMKRNFNAANDIAWRLNNDTSWIAELESSKGTTRYDMVRFDPWKRE